VSVPGIAPTLTPTLEMRARTVRELPAAGVYLTTISFAA
jgi:hypothetical protein